MYSVILAMEFCTACKETGVFETLHVMIRLLCNHWIHSECLAKAEDCVECRQMFVREKRKIFMRAKAFAGRKVPEEFSKHKESIGMSGYLKVVITLDDNGSIRHVTEFEEYGEIGHPICLAARNQEWKKCEDYAEKRWKDMQYMEKRRTEEKEAKRRMDVWILNKVEGDEGVECN